MSVLSRVGAAFRGAREKLASIVAPNPADVVNQVAIAVPLFGINRPRPTDFDLRLLIDEGYRRNVVIYCCVNEIASSASAPRLFARDSATKKELPDSHPLQALLRVPHSHYSRFQLIEMALMQQQMVGSAYIHKGRNSKGDVIQLTPLRAERIRVIPDIDGNVKSYYYSLDGMKVQILDRADVIPILLPDPLNDYYGLPPIVVCAKMGDIDSEASLFLRDFFVNGGVPGGLLKFKQQVMSQEQRETVREQWWETYGRSTRGRDSSNWHNVAILNGEVDYQKIGTGLGELKLDGVWGITETRICSVFKVPPIIVGMRTGLAHATYSNYESAVRSFWLDTMSPIYHRFDDRLTMELASEFGDDIEIVFDLEHVPGLQESQDVKVERALKQYAGGILTRNEAREHLEIEPLKVDAIVMPQGAIVIDETGAEIVDETPAPGAAQLPPAPVDDPAAAEGVQSNVDTTQEKGEDPTDQPAVNSGAFTAAGSKAVASAPAGRREVARTRRRFRRVV